MSIHITPHKNGWQVKTGGKEKAYRVVETQEEAIVIAKKVAKIYPFYSSFFISY
mgnify:CR=1 FL=1